VSRVLIGAEMFKVYCASEVITAFRWI